METHIPVIFLNIKREKDFTLLSDAHVLIWSDYFKIRFIASPADDLSSQDQFELPEAGGLDATLGEEYEDDFFDLQIVKHYDGEVQSSLLELFKYTFKHKENISTQ